MNQLHLKQEALRFILEMAGNPVMPNLQISGIGGISTWRDALDRQPHPASTPSSRAKRITTAATSCTSAASSAISARAASSSSPCG